MNINVSIERLILHGLPVNHAQGLLVRAAVEAELARLLKDRGLDRLSPGAAPSLATGAITLIGESKPGEIGHEIAREIYSTLAPAPAAPHPTCFPGAPRR